MLPHVQREAFVESASLLASGAKMTAAKMTVSYNGTKMVAGIIYFHIKRSKALNNNCANKTLWLGLGTEMSGLGLGKNKHG